MTALATGFQIVNYCIIHRLMKFRSCCRGSRNSPSNGASLSTHCHEPSPTLLVLYIGYHHVLFLSMKQTQNCSHMHATCVARLVWVFILFHLNHRLAGKYRYLNRSQEQCRLQESSLMLGGLN